MELQKYKFALPSKGMQARNTLDAILDEKDIELNISLEINDISILLGLVQKSSLATFVSRASIPEHCNLAAIPLDSSNCEMEGCVHLAKGRYVKKATKEFIEMLTETDSIIMMRHKWFEDIH